MGRDSTAHPRTYDRRRRLTRAPGVGWSERDAAVTKASVRSRRCLAIHRPKPIDGLATASVHGEGERARALHRMCHRCAVVRSASDGTRRYPSCLPGRFRVETKGLERSTPCLPIQTCRIVVNRCGTSPRLGAGARSSVDALETNRMCLGCANGDSALTRLHKDLESLAEGNTTVNLDGVEEAAWFGAPRSSRT
jgi:hypothetical protein